MWKSDKPEGKRTMAEEVEAEDNSLASNLGRQEAADEGSALVGKGGARGASGDCATGEAA